MKKVLLLLFLLFSPLFVFAAGDINISSIELDSKSLNVEEIEPASVDNNNLKLNIRFYDKDDFIKYKLVIKNISNEEVTLNKDDFLIESNYLESRIEGLDEGKVLNSNEEITILLVLTYKTEVDSTQFVNNTFVDNKTININFDAVNNTEPVKTNNEETTVTPVKFLVNNPPTSTGSITMVIVLFVISLISLILTIRYGIKAAKVLLLLLIPLMSIPIVVNAYLRIIIIIDIDIEIVRVPSAYNEIKELAKDESCIAKYDGEVTDEVGKTVSSSNVYFNKCADKRNFILGNVCWEMIRTTENKGVRMLYNGPAVDGKCESTRGKHIGVNSTSGGVVELSEEYLYGSYFTIDEENRKLVLHDTFKATWNDENYEELIGKFTCKTDGDTCDNVYNINDYASATTAYVSAHGVTDTRSGFIGGSPYNASSNSLAGAGYMFNKTDTYYTKTMTNTSYLYGSAFTYDSETNTYTLSGTTQVLSNWEEDYDKVRDTHYTCFKESGVCKNLYYIVFTTGKTTHVGGRKPNTAYVVKVKDGIDIKTYVDNLLHADDVNKYNSSIKNIIDNWYFNNYRDYTKYLDNSVYCNNRDILAYNPMEPDGGKTTENYEEGTSHNLYFGGNSNNTLICNNITDQFSTSNNKAKLTYPIALPTKSELEIMSAENTNLRVVGENYYTMTPNIYSLNPQNYLVFNINGGVWITDMDFQVAGVRPVVTLNSKAKVRNGNGTQEKPWIIK